MLIKLTSDWTDGENQFPVGSILDVDDNTALKLWQETKADRYAEKPKENEPVALSKESIDELVKAAVDSAVEKSSAAPTIAKAVDGDEEYFKTGGFKSIAHFCRDIYRAGPNGRRASTELKAWEVKTAGHMAEGDDAQGGYLVPTEFLARLLEKGQEAAIVRPRAQFIPMATNSISMPYVAESSRASTLYGGIVIYHPAEAGAKTETKPAFGKLTLTLKKLVGFIYASDELLEDSPISIEPMITRMFSKAISFTEEEEFVNGTGVGQALGVLNAGCLVSVAKETGQAAATLVYNNIVKMWSRLHAPSQGSAVWLVNNDCFPQLATLALPVGTGGAPAYLPANGLSGSPYGALMGRPVIMTEHCQTLGTVGDIILADWSQYLIGGKSGSPIKSASSMHFYFNYDETVFRFVMRYDGQPWWQTTLTPKHGANTQSPFVALATRA